ncbi:MAG: hypothetical protein HC853_03705 [Anaerolineae bacterium]|nr:hypothetical protein [Anaerolineae bacterium]
MLLRRLKQRLRESGNTHDLRCIATSASLTGNSDDRIAVARFASELFGEPFFEDDIITGEVSDIPATGTHELDADAYRRIQIALDGKRSDAIVTLDKGRLQTHQAQQSSPVHVAGALLQQDARANKLRKLITGSPIPADAVADDVFADLPKPDRVNALAQLVNVLSRSKDATDAPLLSARYHLFLKALESAHVAFHPTKHVTLDHRSKEAKASFEVALCRECGQHYFVGIVDAARSKLVEPNRDPGDSTFGAHFFRPINAADDDLSDEPEEADTSKKAKDKKLDEYELCLVCGNIAKGKTPCTCTDKIRIVKEENAAERPDQIKRCGACGYNASGRDPVRELSYGNDGPHAVIASALYQNLPEGQRKVLAFADGRQEAAFFAWYFEASYRDILSRNLLLAALREMHEVAPKGASIRSLARSLREVFREQGAFDAYKDDIDLLEEAYRSVYREFMTEEKRISLAGVGLAHWSLVLPDQFSVPACFTSGPWSLTTQDARHLISWLFDTMRADFAADMPVEKGVNVSWDDLNVKGQPRSFQLASPHKSDKDRNRFSLRNWDGEQTQRVKFLTKLLCRRDPQLAEGEAKNSAVQALRDVWDAAATHDRAARSPEERLLIAVEDKRRLNPNWWRLRSVSNQETIYRCGICGTLHIHSISNVCTKRHCEGELVETTVAQLPTDHYRALYTEALPSYLRAEEHTAQLNPENAKKFQQDFKEGRIHILSCSTTFEVGVDLGDLNTVFLRNVPPEAFNYAQRVGRAGRRAGSAGVAITYCRRNPHDLYHFIAPERIIRGQSRPPTLFTRNPKIVLRHMTAWALSHFFRSQPQRFVNVQAFFENLLAPSAIADLQAHLQRYQSSLQQSLSQIVPAELHVALGLNDTTWIDQLCGSKSAGAGTDSRLALAELEVSSDYATVTQLMNTAKVANDFGVAKWAQQRAETIASENVLKFLSQRAIIPKYGFPVDVVTLDTQPASRNRASGAVQLQRDLALAISEFAPSSELIANKKVWQSYGLKKVAGKEWPRRHYRRCKTHNSFVEWQPGESEPVLACGCAGRETLTGTYVVPIFGFTSSRLYTPHAPTGKTSRLFATRPYFAGCVGVEPDEIPIRDRAGNLVASLRKASPGRLVMLCEGRMGNRFYVCRDCGFGSLKHERTHRNPHGGNCSGLLDSVSLGHEFETDVLQLQFVLPDHLRSDIGFMYSLAYALAEGAVEMLEVPSSELSATIFVATGQTPRIVLYDNAPGRCWFSVSAGAAYDFAAVYGNCQ